MTRLSDSGILINAALGKLSGDDRLSASVLRDMPEAINGVDGANGSDGPAGPVGPAGPAGDDGIGVPAGGTAGQILAKINGTDYNTQWVTPASGGASGGSWPGIHMVDDYGAMADCPRTGSTAGATDDSDAIEAAFRAAPEGAGVWFTPGKVYMVTRPISVTGKSVAVSATGATIRCGDDTVWHVFTLGGANRDDADYTVRWSGGTLDGNLANQRYYPNQVTVPGDATLHGGTADPLRGYMLFHTDLGQFATNDGGQTHVTWVDIRDGQRRITGRSLTVHNGPVGTRFYENSPVNGTDWDDRWINGSGGSRINVNGGGNDGLIKVVVAKLAVFDDIECRSFVRNGITTYGVQEVHANRIRGVDQLYTTYQELNSMFGLQHECAVMKFSGDNNGTGIIGRYYPQRVFVSNCYAEKCVMPLFVRSQPPKAPVLGIECKVTNCTFTGVSRELWFEVVQDLLVTGTTITSADYPDSTFRKNDAIFIGNGTESYSFVDCHIYGRINSEELQGRVRGSYDNCMIRDFSGSEQRTLECGSLTNCIVETRAGGLRADYVRGSHLYLEDVPGSKPTQIELEMTDSTYGRERYAGTRERVLMANGDESVTLSGTPSAVQRVFIRSRAFQGGRWFELATQDYTLSGAVLTLSKSGQNFSSTGVTEIEVDWYANRTDTLTTTAALETTYTLTQAGGTRRQDIVSITYGGVAVGHVSDAADPASDPRWSAAMNAAGRMVITLAGVTIADGTSLVVTYRPLLEPYRCIRMGNGDTTLDITATNFKGIEAFGGKNWISGIYSDVQAPTFVGYRNGVELVEIDGVTVDRLSGGLVCGINGSAQVRELRIKRSHIRDWMMEFSRLSGAKSVAQNRALGCLSTNGTQALRWMEFSDNVMAFSGRETGASKDAGRNQSGVLTNGCAVVGGNAYPGGVTAADIGVGPSATRLARADYLA